MRRLRSIFIMMLIFVFVLTNSISSQIISVSSATKSAGTEEDNLGISEYVGNGFQVAFKIEDSWKDGYNATVSIKNTGNNKIENWCLVFELSNEITNIWNAKIKKNEGSIYTILNDSWNQDISVGNSVSFGFTAKGDIKELPDVFSLPGQRIEIDSGSYSVEYVITQDWIEGYNAQVTINNNTAEALEDWQIEFDFANKISELWNAVIIDYTKKHYIVVNDTYNSHIAPHGSVSFGFHVDKGSSAELLENISVYEHKTEIESDDAFVLLDGEINEEKDTLTLYIDSVYESYACDIYLAWQSGETKLLTTTEEQVYDINLADMENAFSCFVTQKTDEGILKSNCLNIILNDDGFEIEMIDQDGDNLPDYFEEFIGTDSNNTDTDGDGLSDYYEYYELDTDPLDSDTDNNQIADGDEDSDSDGLTDLEEMNYETDPYEKDTDKDGLSDFDEIHLYKTDPTDADTDADYMDDGDEINFNQNPLDEDSNQDGVEDGYEVYTVELGSDKIENDGVVIPSLKMDVEGCYIPSLFVNEIDKTDEYLNDTIPGYIGSAYDFNVSEGIKDNLNATITYQFDKKLLDDAFEPVIYYLNEETMELEKVENQKVEGNSVVAQVKHFSIYVMLNSKKFDDVWNGSLLEAKAIELVLDGSASMEWNDRDNIRYHCADSLIDKMGKNDEVAVIGFDNKARVVQTFTTDKAMAQHAVRDTFTDGGTDICNAIGEGIMEFAKADDTKGKYMILLTDGSSSTNGIDSLLSDAKAKKIRIFTIGLGKGVNTSLLEKIAEKTGGMYYFASVAEELPDVFEKIETGGLTSGGSGSSTGIKQWRPTSALAYAVDKAGFVYEQKQDIIISKLHPRQEKYGFTYGYDNLSAYLDMNIDCEPIYFFYNNKEYMVEFWKGQYGAETGGEIGVYYREIKALKKIEEKYGKWYKANSSDLWDMSFSLSESSNKLFERPEKHWWLTGFKWGKYVNSPSKLNMKIKFNFINTKLAQAFVNGYNGADDKKLYDEARKKKNLNNYNHSDDGIYGLKARGYQLGEKGYEIDGKRVNVYFSKAKCKQPKKMVKMRKKVRKNTKYATQTYRIVRCLMNQTEEKKKHPNDPNNFDISCCKKLDKEKTKKCISAVYNEGKDVYNQFITCMKKKNFAVATRLDKAVQGNNWSNLSDKDFKKISKLLCKYYNESYTEIEKTPSKLVDEVMTLAEKVVKAVYE